MNDEQRAPNHGRALPCSVLRLCGEDMQLAGGTLEAVLRQMRDPEVDELDLSSQRADVNQVGLIRFDSIQFDADSC